MKKKMILLIIIAAVLTAVYLKTRSAGDFRYSGTLEATEVDLSSRISGVISRYAVEEGEQVKKDALVAALECEDLRLAADIAAKDYERAVELYAAGSMSKENSDRLKYKRDDSALKAGWCTIKSPVAGRVLYTFRENGELVAPGVKIATVADLSSVWAYIYVPHDLIVKIKPGMELKGILSELPDREFAGRISVINEEAEFTPKNVQTARERTRLVFGVKVTFPNEDGILKPGMTIEVKLPEYESGQ
ncbi:MAG: hypothetical protein A2X34_07255 [Elusimicrobia bacterium GWC2_51_8]|nr:MAG: hypothetical protein A2X33_05650 [Elusimicrobia bacterium GWA2_51_34]OGR64033.1 MAG: hypothetical protein A2X34_07255 [Elusimicrobia bacterium GWC2_51_8]HAF94977.1 secretion protein HlyD [Elusimicrobiota bacterium]HCE99113.1 secretion protein HlyD [Elusimicrobiota bacterium]